MSEEKKEEKQEEKKEESASEESAPVEVPEKFKTFVEQIEQMSVLDLAELVKILEDKFGVSAAAPVAMVAGGGSEDGEATEEKDSFDIELSEAGGNKISVIKVVREITQKGLKEAKDLVDAAPGLIKEGAKKDEAEEIKTKLEEAGATVALK